MKVVTSLKMFSNAIKQIAGGRWCPSLLRHACTGTNSKGN